MFARMGNGTGWNPFSAMVKPHHKMSITTMTVVICMIFNAFWLDS